MLVWFQDSINVNLHLAAPSLPLCHLLQNTEQIQQIMTLEESVQHVVMTAIQEVSEPPPDSLYFTIIQALSHD